MELERGWLKKQFDQVRWSAEWVPRAVKFIKDSGHLAGCRLDPCTCGYLDLLEYPAPDFYFRSTLRRKDSQ